MRYVDYSVGAEKEHRVYLEDVSADDEVLLEKLGFKKSEAKDDDAWVKPYGLGCVAAEYVREHSAFYFKQMSKRKEERRCTFISETRSWEANADETVLGFIYDFVWKKAASEEEYEMIRSLFMDGYCYYFATMLKTAFSRGEICWCAPFGHFVWMDENGVPYDIEGVSTAEAEYYIPERYVAEGLDDFKHVPGKSFGATKAYIGKAIECYKKDRGISDE